MSERSELMPASDRQGADGLGVRGRSPWSKRCDTDTDTETEAPVAETDEARAAVLAVLEPELGEAIVGSEIKVGRGLWVRVTAEAWATAAEVAKAKLSCRFFDFLSAIDWMPSPFGRYEDAEIDTPESLAEKVATAQQAERTTGYAGGDSRFQVLAHVIDVVGHRDLFLKADVPDDTLTVPTWTKVHAGANWHEREAWEMYGITFDGHPDLRKLYLPGEFEGNPLRKDFPLLARVVKPWPGIVDVERMPGEAGDDEGEEGEVSA